MLFGNGGFQWIILAIKKQKHNWFFKGRGWAFLKQLFLGLKLSQNVNIKFSPMRLRQRLSSFFYTAI